MGRHNKKSLYARSSSSPGEEKRKIRQSILNLFQKHFKAEKNAVSSNQEDKEKRQSQSPSSISDSFDSNPRMGSQDEILRRKRRRKTKAERNKTRSKSASCQATEEKADVNRHLKAAHSVSYPLRSKGQPRDDSHNAITQNRLTKRLGLFNKSKKSGTALRVPIVLTESLRKETEEDLKKILNVNDERREVAMETDHETMGRTSNPPSSLSHHLPAVLYEPQARVKMTPTNPAKPSYSQSLREMSTCPSSVEVDEFPEVPPMEDIVQQLANKLEDHKIFKGIDLAKDLCDDLNKIMKHNAPRDSTPASMRVGRAIPASATSSVCRSLFDSFTPIHNIRNYKSTSADRAKSVPMSVTLSAERPSVSQETREIYKQVPPFPRQYNYTQASSAHQVSSIKDLVAVAHMENIASKVKQNTHTGNLSAIDMLKRNDNLCLQREISCTVSNPHAARNLLSIPGREQYFEPSNHPSVDSSNKENLLNVMQVDSQSNRSYSSQDGLTNSQSSGFHSVTDLTAPPDLKQVLNNPSALSRHNDTGHSHESHQAVLTEYHETTQYMPRFHGDFYKDSLWFEKTILSSIDQVSNPSQNSRSRENDQASSMDILDFIDQNSQASVDILPGHSRNLSPKWQESTYLLPPKTISPDSPQMLPRRLY